MDRWKEAKDGFDKWLKITCYLGFVWVALDILPYLPAHIVDRVIEGVLRKLGI
jgi:hypothetical protein